MIRGGWRKKKRRLLGGKCRHSGVPSNHYNFAKAAQSVNYLYKMYPPAEPDMYQKYTQ